MNDAISLNITGTALTISAWIKPSTFGENSKGRIVDKHNGGTTGYVFNLDSSNTAKGLGFGVNSANSTAVYKWSISNVINLNQWQHVAVVYNGSVAFYVNGVNVSRGSSDISASINSSASVPLSIGGRFADGRDFNGAIDDIRIYNRALSAAEIAAFYALGTDNGADVTPPLRLNGSPIGTLPSGTGSTTISLTTNENAVCKYDTAVGIAYAAMMSFFTTTGGTNHAATITGLTNYIKKFKKNARS